MLTIMVMMLTVLVMLTQNKTVAPDRQERAHLLVTGK